MAQGSDRGSHPVLKRLFGGSGDPTHDDVKAALSLEKLNYEVLSWWWKGQPNPWELYIDVLVDKGQVGELTQQAVNRELSVTVSGVGARGNRVVASLSNVPSEAR